MKHLSAILLLLVNSACWSAITTMNIGTLYLRDALPFTDGTLLVFPVTGQSLANGSGSTNALSTSAATNNIYSQGNGQVQAWPFAVTTGLTTPLAEISPTETITTAMLVQLRYLGSRQGLAGIVNAEGGVAYTGLKKGTGIYSNNMVFITNCTIASVGYPIRICPAWIMVHGETDKSSSSYQTDLMQFAGDIATDVISATRQTVRPVIFNSQISSQSGASDSLSDFAMLDETLKGNPSNLLVCAKFMFPYDQANSPHLMAQGYQWLGEMYGKAIYDYFWGGYWNPLCAVRATISGNTITATFTNTSGGLVFDTSHVLVATNYGFNVLTNGTPLPISSVAITGAASNQVLITCVANPSGTTQVSIGVWETGATDWTGGTTNILRSNLRNNDSRTGALSGTNLWDWAVHQRINAT